jgi:hypothetical protein
MAKKSKKKEDVTKKVVAKCDNPNEVVANCNNPEEVIANSFIESDPRSSGDNQQFAVTKCDLKNINIENLIHIVRGQKIMLDSDLAMLYGVETRALNQAVKRNLRRFPDDFMFQVTKEEWNALRSQIVTLEDLKSQTVISNSVGEETNERLTSQNVILKNGRGHHRKFMPYVFTRNGIGMLSSVLRSETAADVNIRIMRAFTAIPDIVNNNVLMMQRILNIEQHQTETDEKVNQIITTIEKRLPEQQPEQIFPTGCVWDAWAYVSDLVRSAKQRIVLIDNFVDDRVLTLLDKRAEGVETTIHSRYYEPFQTDLKKHNEQYREIKFIQLSQKNHDRFLMIDDDVYLLGASVKDMGVGMCAVTKMEASPETILALLK